MLIQLDIENVAVIEKASVEFEKGLNIITGETGAGKSLLINSLNMVLGFRSSHEMIRSGSDFAKVSATFFVPEISAALAEFDIECADDTVVVTRKIYADGRNVCHVNNCAVNVSVLKAIGERMVVIHGQRDSGMLFDTSTHISLLDEYAENRDLLKEYTAIYNEYKEADRQLKSLSNDEKSRDEEIDYLQFRIDEIEKAELSSSEEESLIGERQRLENSEALSRDANTAYSAISDDGGAKESLYCAMRSLQNLTKFDTDAQVFADKASDLYYELEELARDVCSYKSKIEYNPDRLNEIADRLDIINTLKRKYNTDIDGILKYYDEARSKLEALLSFDSNRKKAEDKVKKLYNDASLIAKALTESRKHAANELAKKLEKELEYLDMPRCRVEFLLTPGDLTTLGAEAAELLISTNPSEAPKSVSKIASGGEMSRIMLAVKSVFSDFEKVPTLLFDEIDTGVSGRAAEKIANKMKSLSRNFQLICITHLPVIASKADNHLLIEKKTDGESFITTVKTLNKDERIREIARIISGDNISDVSLENARSMLERQ